MNVTAERVIALQVSYNLRHIGGYRTRTGASTNGEIIRAGSLHLLQEPGIVGLCQLGVRTIVDLRSTEERHRDPTPDLSRLEIETIHAPVFERDASPAALRADFAGYAPVYRQFLETGRDAYRTLFEALADIVRGHHERWDGRGYPDGLAGTQIPLAARIVAVADTFDALTSPRTYRAARSVDQAIAELRRVAGSQLDPDCVAAFLAWLERERRQAQADRAA